MSIGQAGLNITAQPLPQGLVMLSLQVAGTRASTPVVFSSAPGNGLGIFPGCS